MKLFKYTFLTILLGIILSCSSNSQQEDDLTFEDSTPSQEAPSATVSEEYSYYFDFDKYDLKPEFVQLLEEQLPTIRSVLNDDYAVKLRIEGNADERGSREYNLSLGQRRADIVASFLKKKGIDSSRITTMSYGKERPLATGHDEASWAKNRRTDIKFYK